MNNIIRFTLGGTLIVLFTLTAFLPSPCCATTESHKPGIPGKIELSVLYAGHLSSEREKDFVSFLDRHFKKVGKMDLETFTEDEANGFDVVIMDYDGRCHDAPRPKLSRSFDRATVTVAGVGALIGDTLRLKTGYT